MTLQILSVSDVYFPRVNGVSTSIETFRRTLAGQGVDMRLVVPRYGGESEQEGIVRVAARTVPLDREDRLLTWGEARRMVLAEARDSDLLHVHTPFVAHYAALKAARRLDKPLLATYHTLFEEYLFHYAPFLPAAWLKGLARRFSRTQCNELDAVVVPSSAMRDRLVEYGVEAPMHILPTGIPLSRFASGDRERFRERHGIPIDRPVALYVGRVAHEKNIDFLLESVARACRTVPELLFLITGEGPAEKALRKRAEELDIQDNVRFMGYLDREHELPDCYAAADAFLFASKTETQGLVLLEAMAMGLPVVALAVMGTCDILGPGRGGIVPADDVAEFAAAIVQLVEDAALRKRLSDEAREYALEWADEQMAARLARLYRSLS